MDEETVDAIENVAAALQRLGVANANTPMGAIELLAKEVKEGTERIANAIDNLADAVRAK